ncbi:MAG TPA: type II secretion system protein [Verrucomicrobiales bacterium]|jgi:type II secretory pathway pseudopilin PulG|nr:type II secretion system protein [Verrucomicrobiales bacterium]
MKTYKAAFGMAEVLVVIAIVGVITAVAIPAMSGLFGRADSAKAERNAQNLVSTFNAARAAGNSTSYASASDAITALTTSPGITGSGKYFDSIFYVPMEATQVAEASSRIVPTLAGPPNEGNLLMAP